MFATQPTIDILYFNDVPVSIEIIPKIAERSNFSIERYDPTETGWETCLNIAKKHSPKIIIVMTGFPHNYVQPFIQALAVESKKKKAIFCVISANPEIEKLAKDLATKFIRSPMDVREFSHWFKEQMEPQSEK